MFRQDQDELSCRIGLETDPEKRRKLQLQKEIEGCDYMVITSERIAQQSDVVGNSGEAGRQYEKARFYEERGRVLREEWSLSDDERRRRMLEQLDARRGGSGPDREPDKGYDLKR